MRLLIAYFLISMALGAITLKLYYNQPLRGYAKIVDGDTFWISGEIVRLKDVDAPEHGQKGYTEATNMLNLLTFGEEIVCTNEGIDIYKRILARCYLGDKDIGAQLARDCVVWGYNSYANPDCKLGEEPWKFRKRNKTAFHMPLLLDNDND